MIWRLASSNSSGANGSTTLPLTDLVYVQSNPSSHTHCSMLVAPAGACVFGGHDSTTPGSEHTLSVGHCEHWAADVSPLPIPYVPAGHLLHTPIAALSPYVPAGQGAHPPVPLAEYVPTPHCMHDSIPSPA